MELHEKTQHKDLYACTEIGCRTMTFAGVTAQGAKDICPTCGAIGLHIRGPIDTSIASHRDEVRTRLAKEQKKRLKKERKRAVKEQMRSGD